MSDIKNTVKRPLMILSTQTNMVKNIGLLVNFKKFWNTQNSATLIIQ